MKQAGEKRGLGRGLAALMGDLRDADVGDGDRNTGSEAVHVPVERLHPNPDQPRRRFPPHALEELAASIKAQGVIQPLIVRPLPGGAAGEFQIVAGERRWRAAQLAKLHEIPVLVRILDDLAVLEVAIIENVQRADLNILEEAEAYRQLMDRFGHSQEKLSEGLGKSRSHIANTLRLLSLPEEVKSLLRDGRLSAGHARALITAIDPIALARTVLDQGMSVRETEQLAKRQKRSNEPGARKSIEKDTDTLALEQDLSAALGMEIAIDQNKNGRGGEVRIRYRNMSDLDKLCRQLSRQD